MPSLPPAPMVMPKSPYAAVRQPAECRCEFSCPGGDRELDVGRSLIYGQNWFELCDRGGHLGYPERSLYWDGLGLIGDRRCPAPAHRGVPPRHNALDGSRASPDCSDFGPHLGARRPIAVDTAPGLVARGVPPCHSELSQFLNSVFTIVGIIFFSNYQI